MYNDQSGVIRIQWEHGMCSVWISEVTIITGIPHVSMHGRSRTVIKISGCVNRRLLYAYTILNITNFIPTVVYALHYFAKLIRDLFESQIGNSNSYKHGESDPSHPGLRPRAFAPLFITTSSNLHHVRMFACPALTLCCGWPHCEDKCEQDGQRRKHSCEYHFPPQCCNEVGETPGRERYPAREPALPSSRTDTHYKRVCTSTRWRSGSAAPLAHLSVAPSTASAERAGACAIDRRFASTAARAQCIFHAIPTPEDPREDLPTNDIVLHDSHMRKSGVARPGIGPGSPWWEARRLTARPLAGHGHIRRIEQGQPPPLPPQARRRCRDASIDVRRHHVLTTKIGSRDAAVDRGERRLRPLAFLAERAWSPRE
ncbi:hypothetical protein PR048_016194 [Dryococelus australis]|uniref:Uncharacterized protein n=1 Tax=Dryococelus australis TaxID=614101 RepID=A0ABQ9HJ16_9NEOP|nr:hypothetical protein PR048_016194 [Dryococelus australis]